MDGRYPGCSAQVSWGDGYTYRAFTFPGFPCGNGGLVEVAPEVLLLLQGSDAPQWIEGTPSVYTELEAVTMRKVLFRISDDDVSAHRKT